MKGMTRLRMLGMAFREVPQETSPLTMDCDLDEFCAGLELG